MTSGKLHILTTVHQKLFISQQVGFFINTLTRRVSDHVVMLSVFMLKVLFADGHCSDVSLVGRSRERFATVTKKELLCYSVICGCEAKQVCM